LARLSRLSVATKDGVAALAMRHGKANALDTEPCRAPCGALDDAAAEGAAAVVLTGAGTVFSAGADLKRVTAEPAPTPNPAFCADVMPGMTSGSVDEQ